MKIIGIQTSDFRLYYDLVKALREADVPFLSLAPGDEVPASVGVLVTSGEEVEALDFPAKVAATGSIGAAIAEARRLLAGKTLYEEVVVGIDPGKMPGFAVIADGEVMRTAIVPTPEDTGANVMEALEAYPAGKTLVRVGHGALTHRNRIINTLGRLAVRVEIVDETSTTRRAEQPDIQAAIDIALMQGVRARRRYDIAPTDGELRDIQRMSRIISEGRLTISKEMAEKVARGEVSMLEAVNVPSDQYL